MVAMILVCLQTTSGLSSSGRVFACRPLGLGVAERKLTEIDYEIRWDQTSACLSVHFRVACPAQPSLPRLDFIGWLCRSSLKSLANVTQGPETSTTRPIFSALRGSQHHFTKGRHDAKDLAASLMRAAPGNSGGYVPEFCTTVRT